MRTAFYPMYPTQMISVPYVLAWIIGSLVVGLAMQRVMRFRIVEH
ncbi:hypothetical protein A6302_00876 [Methylobrevis pamukkalensis]|uniref:Uncharacterized protein n=1 Tax=Methylobrevis pamukkalensis TaxID=1439726 RepID=A0A1E3H6H4_9HYPH|nr:hypothetical protein A6302_00876 [Methylobrevis pamukkalensis]